MRKVEKRPGFICYEKEAWDEKLEAAVKLAQMQAQSLSDEQAAEVAALYDVWREGTLYNTGTLVRGADQKIYRVQETQVAQTTAPGQAVGGFVLCETEKT